MLAFALQFLGYLGVLERLLHFRVSVFVHRGCCCIDHLFSVRIASRIEQLAIVGLVRICADQIEQQNRENKSFNKRDSFFFSHQNVLINF